MSSDKRSPVECRRRRSNSFRLKGEPKPTLATKATKAHTGNGEASLMVTPSNEEEIREQVRRLIHRSPDVPRQRSSVLRRSGSSLARLRVTRPDLRRAREDALLEAVGLAKERGKGARLRRRRLQLLPDELRLYPEDAAAPPLTVPLAGAAVKSAACACVCVTAADGVPSVKLQLEDDAAAATWAAALARAAAPGIAARVQDAACRPANALCADCRAAGPRHAAPDLATFVCAECASVLATLGCRVLPLAGPWAEEDVALLEAADNERANGEWGARMPPAAGLAQRASREERVRHLHAKYVQRSFHSSSAPDSGLSAEFVRQALLEALAEDACFRASVRDLVFAPAHPL